MNLSVIKYIGILFLVSYQVSVLAKPVVLFGVDHNGYMANALKLAMSRVTEKDYQVEFFQGDLPKVRAFERMERGDGIDVVFGGSHSERDSNYLPVRFPLLKGLNGWRVPLVHKDNLLRFKDVSDLEDLKKFKAGLYFSWSDTRVMEANHLPVIKASNYPALYNMLSKKRFDYFPRSILEIDSDFARNAHLDIAIDPNLLIYYPTAYFYYVSKNNVSLAEDILRGLNRAKADGSLDQLYMQYFGEVIAKYGSGQRTVIRLSNPFLSDAIPLDNKALWIDLEQFTQ